MTIVVCSKGYPGNYTKNKKINNLSKFYSNKKLFIYHAGTKIVNNEVISNGGRVLNVTSLGNSFKKIRRIIIKAIKAINWKHGFFRKDIGWRVIKK